MKIGENTEFKLDVKTIISIVVFTSTIMGMYYTLESDIEEAKKLPPAEVKRLEYDLKQQWTEGHILALELKVKELEADVKQIDKEIHHGNKEVKKEVLTSVGKVIKLKAKNHLQAVKKIRMVIL